MIAALEGNKEFVEFLIENNAILPPKSGIKQNILDFLKVCKKARDAKIKELEKERIGSIANDIVKAFNQKFETLNSQQYTGQDSLKKDIFIFNGKDHVIEVQMDSSKLRDHIELIIRDQSDKKFFTIKQNPKSLTIELNPENLKDDTSRNECLESINQLIAQKELDFI